MARWLMSDHRGPRMSELQIRPGAAPDLQALVLKHDGWPNIPPEAWKEYDAKLANWQMLVRMGAHRMT